jgi:replicative DNA helicase
MPFDHDISHAASWSSDQVARLTQVADHLHRLARPHLYEAMQEPALVRTVHDLPADAPLRDLASAVAENALRRALRAAGLAAVREQVQVDDASWQFACNLTLSELTDDAMRNLRAIARLRGTSRQ